MTPREMYEQLDLNWGGYCVYLPSSVRLRNVTLERANEFVLEQDPVGDGAGSFLIVPNSMLVEQELARMTDAL